jgi:hypothetical protein
MTIRKHLVTGAAAALIGLAGMTSLATGASAYTACNRDGDCWHTDTRVHFPGVSITYHNDKWWDRNRHNSHYSWHDSDNDHDWHRGYWDHGSWHGL